MLKLVSAWASARIFWAKKMCTVRSCGRENRTCLMFTSQHSRLCKLRSGSSALTSARVSWLMEIYAMRSCESENQTLLHVSKLIFHTA